MASTNRSICLYCKATNEIDAEKEFHDIYDELGVELQLPSLVEQFFQVNVEANKKCKQLLCDDCVNRLIELYDLEEHCKTVTANAQSASGEDQNVEEGCTNEISQDDCEPGSSVCNDDIYGCAITDVVPETDGNYVVKDADAHHFNVAEVYAQSVDGTNKSEDSDSQLAFVEEHNNMNAEYQHEDLATFNEHVASESEIDLEHVEPESSDIHLDQNQYETQLSANDVDQTSNNNDVDLLLELDSQKNENSVYEEIILDEGQYEQIENQYYQLDEIHAASTDNVIIEEGEYVEEIEDNSMDVIEESVSGDLTTVDEEYLIEETICSQEYDCVDMIEYLDSAIITKFEDLDLVWTIECKLCLESFDTLQQLLKHSCIMELIEEQQCCCIIKDCEDISNSLKTLARHLVIKHYDNVESLSIYGRCPDCQKTFSNIMDFNKHSCCVFKRKAGTRHYCQACNMDFQSLKRYVFHMQFHLTKHRPKVCLLCGSLFNDVTDFFEHVSYAHEPDTAMACVKCDRFFKDKLVYERHIQCHQSKAVFECTYCPKTYTNRCGLTSHMEIYHNHKTKPLQCEYCNKEFVSQSSYRSHMKVHMPEANVPAFVCSNCGLISNSSDTIKNHIETYEVDVVAEIMQNIISIAYTCESCSLDFVSTRQLHLHRQSSDHSNKTFYCPICRKSFRTLKHMRNHLTSHKDYDQWTNAFPIARFYMCDIGHCRDAYPLWTSLYYHKKRHKDPSSSQADGDNFTCQFCGKLCPTKMSLAIHVARVHNNSHVQCTQCNKMYKTEKDLKEHIEHMHVAIQCTQCQRVLKNRRNLLSHEQLVHKNEKRYFCQYCAKGYYYKSEMEAHEKNVHPEITYKCELCSFSTNYAKSLDIHMAKHKNELPYKCSVCQKTFGRKQLLSTHEKRHQKNKQFVCYDYCKNGCEASYITHFLLKKHIQSKHPDEQNDRKSKPSAKRFKSSNNNMGPIIIVQDDNSCVELVMGNNMQLMDDNLERSDDEYEIHYEYEDEEGADDDDDQNEPEEFMEDDAEMDIGS